MTLLFVHGYEARDNTSWTAAVGGQTDTFVTGTSTRFNSGAAFHGNSTSGPGVGYSKTITASTDVYCGMARKFDSSLSDRYWFSFHSDAAVTNHIFVGSNAQGQVLIWLGSTSTILAQSAVNVLRNGSWYYLEVHCKISDTVGVVDVRLNGSSSNLLSFSGDTKNAGTATTIDQVRVYNSGANGPVDDVYICDGLGSVNNTFLGDVRVHALSPTGAGSSTGLTASTGSNWDTANELPMVATDYSGSPTAAARDTYALADLPSGVTAIKGIQVDTAMHKSDAGAKSMKPAIKSSATVAYGATQVLSASMTHYLDTWETDPATSAAWTTSGINALEAGAEVI